MLTKGNIPLGYMAKAVEQRVVKDDVIPFTELKNCIGKKVLYEGQMIEPRRCYYKIVEITGYLDNVDTFYDYLPWGKSKPVFTCDRVRFKDDNRKGDGCCAVSEAYCSNGRFEHELVGIAPSCFYEFEIA